MVNLRAHNTDNYEVIKKLKIFARERGSSGPWESFGSIKDVTVRVDEQVLEHFSNYLGARVKDREEVTERRCQIDFTFEEFNSLNLKHALGKGWEASADGTKQVANEATEENPGGSESIDLEKTDINSVVVRSVGLEDSVTYAEVAYADASEVTESNDFNNVTSTLTVAAAVTTYGDITFAVGQVFRIGTEILRVTAIVGNDVTFARGQHGSTTAVHADGVVIEEGTGDYAVNLVTGILYILGAAGALDDEGTVAEIHISFQQELDVEEFELFPGNVIECEVQLQYGADDQVEKVFGPISNATIKNNGDIVLGDGSDWAGIPMRIEGFAANDGTFGTVGIIKETQS